ncbi:alpha/beta fold hydrolase [Rhodopseudomonas pseudopalustris]|uniref:Pimeloyl-ACP methyl ester carboxylesterase n=1 Tax=Rhodopseudomonas pseudopalustris TaxID=1513892 RepID=A0A1H8NMK3_9BRAD|nr:alpha/beta hydrolase [Rhodopseudomonas pseudopalustris]SEO30807.1 Pimeloyl-ACP methyl ester carboxylesterase [Rhodopseudomonas pseudopalustris]
MQNPESRFYRSHGLRLHYADWGNDTAPPLLLIHGGADHGRSWDHLARSLRPDFHVVAPDLRGHGDSDWTLGGSYSLPEYIYDLTRLPAFEGRGPITVIGHSMGGMVGLIYAGTFPEKVARLVVLDGVTVLPNAPKPPAHERTRKWIGQLDALEQREPRRYRDIEEAAAQMQAHNKRLTPELALHLATYGVKQNEDGSYSWKFDPYQRVMAPHRLWPDDHVTLWARIACPTLLLFAGESFLGDAASAGIADHFQQARVETVADAGHWLQHDRPDEVLRLIREFLLG